MNAKISNLTLVGAGNMGGALLRGIVQQELVPAANIRVVDPAAPRLEELAGELGVKTATSFPADIGEADVIILAVKPHVLPEVLDELRPEARAEQLVISIIAGVDTEFIRGRLGTEGPVIRVMPNLAATVGASASALAGQASDREFELAAELFRSVGEVVRVEESQIDAVTGLSGSGPAYVFTVIEALADGGLDMGLPRPVALKLAAQTVLGAARLMLESGEHPAVLRDRVMTPGGTTVAGHRQLEKGKLRHALMAAVEAATRRARKLKKRARKGR